MCNAWREGCAVAKLHKGHVVSSKSDRSDEIRTKSDFVVVANRLPVDRGIDDKGNASWRPSPGGLVTALEPFMQQREGAWIGWTGAQDDAPEPFHNNGMLLHPVPLSETEVACYYEGFSNSTLWPVYHDSVVPAEYHRKWWNVYVDINQRFAEAAAQAAAEGAFVWVHDYQLQLVPAMLRQLRPDVKIGFFLHIPFPPTELFAQIPWRKEIVRGLLGADLIGFQLPGGASNFMRLCRDLLGFKPQGNSVVVGARTVRAGAFPISIDTASFNALASKPSVRERAKAIRADLGQPNKILLGVDRLDYTKGIANRLEAFEELLEAGQIKVPDVVMVQVATPSREQVEQYRVLREDIERRVGRINGSYANVGVPAVHYIHRSVDREELVALYLTADVMVVTPLRDGMNLVAKEYVASRTQNKGALILSEFAGAARELRQAYLVNPYDVEGMKLKFMTALTMSATENQRRMAAMRRQVHRNDVDKWARGFVSAMGIDSGQEG